MARIDCKVIIDTPYIFYCSPLLGYIVITDSSNYAKSAIYVYHKMNIINGERCNSKVPDEKREFDWSIVCLLFITTNMKYIL